MCLRVEVHRGGRLSACHAESGIQLRNPGIRAMNLPWLTRLIAGRSVQDGFELPEYGL